ncbi:MAG: SBBP repeat-containing protein [Gammaproteobacteria bacterium]|nr:SBBP repeat-containing protein [Gammaproteobacteria bacterium]
MKKIKNFSIGEYYRYTGSLEDMKPYTQKKTSECSNGALCTLRTIDVSWKALVVVMFCVLSLAHPALASLQHLSSTHYEKNIGQLAHNEFYRMRGEGYGLSFLKDKVLVRVEGKNQAIKSNLVTFTLVLDKAFMAPEGRNVSAVTTNVIKGSNSHTWYRNIPAYKEVFYRSTSGDTEVVFYFNNDTVEYDFRLKPGAELKSAGFKVEGVDRLAINDNGSLILSIGGETIAIKPPVAYQIGDDSLRQAVEVAYAIDHDRVNFVLGGFDQSRELVIDPVIDYATYWGGSGNEAAKVLRLAPDGSGDYYIAGNTVTFANLADMEQSEVTPIESGFLASPVSLHGINKCAAQLDTTQTQQESFSDYDAFIARFDSSHQLVAATYFGGCGNDTVKDLVLRQDAADLFVYVTGLTTSPDFPRVNAPQQRLSPGGHPEKNTADAFVAQFQFLQKTDPDTLETYESVDVKLSTYLGGEGIEGGRAIDVDQNGFIYVAGYTHSRIWSDIGPCEEGNSVLQCTHSLDQEPRDPDDWFNTSAADAFLARISGSGIISYVTYLGGRQDDWPSAITLNDVGTNSVILVGNTGSADFPMGSGTTFRDYRAGSELCSRAEPPFDVDAHPCEDVFVISLSRDAKSVIAATFIGGDRDESAVDVDVDNFGNVFIGGVSKSQGMRVRGDGMINPNTDGQDLLKEGETVLQGDELREFVLARFPLVNPVEFVTKEDAVDTSVFVAKFNAALDTLLYSTFVGGSGNDGLGNMVLRDNSVYLAGNTDSQDLVLSAAFQAHSMSGDGFIIRIDEDPDTRLPVQGFGTLYGGESFDFIDALDVDSNGKILFVGGTRSEYLPLMNPQLGSAIQTRDVVIRKRAPLLDKDVNKVVVTTDLFVGTVNPATTTDSNLTLEVSKSVSGNIFSGNSVSLTYTVENKGTETAQEARLFIDLPTSGISKTSDDVPLTVSASSNCVLLGSPTYCLLGDIEPGHSFRKTVKLSFNVLREGEMIITASVMSLSFDTDVGTISTVDGKEKKSNSVDVEFTIIESIQKSSLSALGLFILLSFVIYSVAVTRRN